MWQNALVSLTQYQGNYKHSRTMEAGDTKYPEELQTREVEDNCQDLARTCPDEKDDDREDLEDHLNMETERVIVQGKFLEFVVMVEL